MMLSNVLNYVIWTPILFGLVALCLPGRWVRSWTLLGALLGFLCTLPLVFDFDTGQAAPQFVFNRSWIDFLSARYHVAVDGISMWFVVLNSFITCLVVWVAWSGVEKQKKYYFAAFLIMSGLINGAFSAQDAVLFYIFFEGMLIPMYLIIGIWGGPRRVYASIKFFLYTLLGSLLMLVAFAYLYQRSGGSLSIVDFQQTPLGYREQLFLFVAFFFAFAVKVPMWPVHTWLPDAHVEAPTGGSMVLAAITLKLGAYGFLRFVLPILPDASFALAPWMIALSLIAVVYIGFIALVQSDMKKLVAYSSIAHMGFVTLGFFLFQLDRELNIWALEGAVMQMISHGFVSAAMFMCIGVLYERVHSRAIQDYGGVANRMPMFAAFFMLFAMANVGLPGTSGFVGEMMVILGAASVNFWYAFAAAMTLILGAAYTLWMYRRVIFGEVVHVHVAQLKDLGSREMAVLTVLAAMVLLMGLYPQFFMERMHASLEQLVVHVSTSKL